jgi:hypothetical protein
VFLSVPEVPEVRDQCVLIDTVNGAVHRKGATASKPTARYVAFSFLLIA